MQNFYKRTNVQMNGQEPPELDLLFLTANEFIDVLVPMNLVHESLPQGDE